VLKYRLPVLMAGKDVEAVRRGGIRLLDDDKRWAAYEKMATVSRRTFGTGMRELVKDVQRHASIRVDGQAGLAVDHVLRVGPHGYDNRCDQLLAEYAAAHAPPLPPQMFYPVPEGYSGGVCQRYHRTAGDVQAGFAENWAMDFCFPPGTPLVAVEAGEITKLSGHPPWEDTWDSQGVFGWSVHFETPKGYHYYVTHLGWRAPLLVGMSVQAGDTIGRVGDQHFRPDHTHYGVTSPHGRADAQARILKVSTSPRIH
jgi:murein DD-endopeptidase MepM/ murein hydrolase activator NlpD